MRTLSTWGIAITLLVASWGAKELLPDDTAYQAPFVTQIERGHTASTGELQLRILDLVTAAHVRCGGWEADGHWLVVDLEAAAVKSDLGASISTAVLRIGATEFSASERPESLLRAPLHVGLAQRGSLAFELPPELPTGQATLVFGTAAFNPGTDAPLGETIELPIDQAELEMLSDRTMLETGWARP